MDKAQMFPFVRNRYYDGKMLTSADFQAEQQYFNSKRAFINQMTLGAGIICGLRVYNLDDLSVLIESGAAIDHEGREIVADESVVYKLTSLKGYKGAEVLSLYIRYRETEIQPVYAGGLNESGAEYENNRVSEGYELFLKNPAEYEDGFCPDSEFFVETPVLRSEETEVSLRMPACACKGKMVKLEFIAKTSSHKPVHVSLERVLRFPAFTAENGSHSLAVSLQEEVLEGEKIWEYWLYTEINGLTESHILLDNEGMADEKSSLNESISLTVRLVTEPPDSLVRRQLGQTNLDIYSSAGAADGIHLADIHMEETASAYVIAGIEGIGADSYITLPAREEERRVYLSYYKEGELPVYKEETGELKEQERELLGERPRGISGGMLTIPLDKNLKKGSSCFSQETVHGLGPGHVYVAAGVADTGDAAGILREARTTVYGDMSLFAERDLEETCFAVAVKVFHERGSFQVAVRLQGEQHTVLLHIPWTAVKAPEEEAFGPAKPGAGQIIPLTPTFCMKPKEKHFFEICFKDMKECELCYEVMDEGGGKIDEDGTYTAPAKPGVYEIRICTAGHGDICTYVYAVVERETAQ